MTRVEIRPRAGGVPEDLGSPSLPGSKSHAQRAMLLAAGTPGGMRLRNAPRSDDVVVLADAMAALGVEVGWWDDDLWVKGGLRPGVRASVHLGENGTALRCLPVVVAMLGGVLTVDGDPGLARRPLGALLELLAQAGIRPSSDRLPLTVDGEGALWPEQLRVDATLTTQVATGAILGLALRARAGLGGGEVRVLSPAAAGYVLLTEEVARAFGHEVRVGRGDDLLVGVPGEAGAAPGEYRVPADPSANAVPMALSTLHGLRTADGSADDAILGGHPDQWVQFDLQRLREASGGERVVFEDLRDRPDSFPVLCAVAAQRDGETEFCGVPALRAKESDRIAAMAHGLSAAGVACRELDDGLVVRGPLPARKEIAELPTTADHRIVMALSLLGTVLPGGVALEHAEAVGKSWPGFFDWLGRVADVAYGGGGSST